ncbi:MAG: hypothetical protein OEY15_14700, partial [Myxococcales bacterium]|nr:hypothetical protein [Myxococcales bacterium]
AGNSAYVGGRDGLRIIDVSKPEWPVRVGTLSDSNTGRVAVQESLAYISGYSNLSNRQGLQVVDVSNPMAPTEVGWLDGSTSSDVVLDGSLAYVPGEWASGLLRIVDISNPTAPVEIGLMLAPGRISAVAIKGTLAYLAYVAYGPTSASGGLQIVDVSDPAAPVERARFPTARPARAVDVLGGIAYLGVPGFGALPSRLLVIDVSDPSAPLEIANVPIDVAVNRPESAYLPELAADRNWLYAPVNGSWDTALAIFDISNPAAPTQQAFDLDEITSVADMALDGDRLYLADAFGAVNVFDVSNPNAIAALGALAIPSGRPGRFGTDSIALGNGLVHAVQWRSGLTIVDFGPEYASARRVTLDVKPGSERNPLELVSRGVIPAAILGAPDLDVTQIDATSLRFGPGEAAPIHPSGGHTADVNGDGLPDLLSHYRTQEMDIAYGDTEVCVRGATVDGVRLEGCDHIDTQPGAGTRRSR